MAKRIIADPIRQQRLKDEQDRSLEELIQDQPDPVIVHDPRDEPGAWMEKAKVGDELYAYHDGEIAQGLDFLGTVKQIEWFDTGYRVYLLQVQQGLRFFTPYGMFNTMEGFMAERLRGMGDRIQQLGWSKEEIRLKGGNEHG